MLRFELTFKELLQPFEVGFEETSSLFNVELDGIKGSLRGQDGKSAYEIAKKYGFEGTETEWLKSLRGKDGKDGKDGQNGVDGKDGYTPIKGVDYFDGKDGQNGKDGMDGYTPQKGIDYFDGADGKDGKDGADGHTPVKGTDYFTEADKAEMVSAVVAALPVYDGEVESV